MREKAKQMDEALVITAKEFYQRMRVSEPTGLRMIHQPGFPVIRAGKKLLIPLAQLERWLEEQAQGGGR